MVHHLLGSFHVIKTDSADWRIYHISALVVVRVKSALVGASRQHTGKREHKKASKEQPCSVIRHNETA